MKFKIFKNSLTKLSEKNRLRFTVLYLTAVMATSFAVTGCSSNSENEVSRTNFEITTDIESIGEKIKGIVSDGKAPFVVDDSILQIILIESKDKMILKCGYLYLKDDNLFLLEAYSGETINLTYTNQMSEDIWFYTTDVANFCNNEQLLDGGITKEFFDELAASEIRLGICRTGETLYTLSIGNKSSFLSNITYQLDVTSEEKIFIKNDRIKFIDFSLKI